MNFHEWLKEEHGKSWEEVMQKTNIINIVQYTFDYEFFCYSKGIEPTWV